jgi:hypothetical protein
VAGFTLIEFQRQSHAAALLLFDLLLVLTVGFAVGVQGAPTPYSADAATLHLWHLDEAAPPCVDSATGGTNLTALVNGATLGPANSAFAGFGTCLSTVDGGQSNPTQKDAALSVRPLLNGTGDDVLLTLADPVTGAFTFEALVRVDFDPAASLAARGSPMQIISGDGDGTLDRVFQWRIIPAGIISGSSDTNVTRMEFINLRQGTGIQSLGFLLPTNGVNAIASNQWYHVAVTYDGNENAASNLLCYWTRVDAAVPAANLIGAAKMSNDLSVAACDFVLGNEGRATGGSTDNFIGLIDEVRISRVARAGDQMLFGTNASPDAVRILAGPMPANLTVLLGQPASFAISVGGTNMALQWRHAGVPLPGETNATLALAAARLEDAGAYDVVATNGFPSAVTSSVATLVVTVPEPSPSGPFLTFVPIDDGNPNTSEYGYAGSSSINTVNFVRNALHTENGQQFIAYYYRHATNASDPNNNRIVIARRSLQTATSGTNLWQMFFTPFTANNITDGHDVASFGIDGSGIMHLSWGMHGDAFHYARSTTSVFATNAIVFGPDTTMTGNENTVTYPQWLRLPGGDLLYLFREGSSGNGDTYMNRYHTASQTWSNVHVTAGAQQPFIKGRGWMPNYNAYPNMPQLDAAGNFHLVWTWRYNSDSPAGEVGFQTNHDFDYARSPDGGLTWLRQDGTAYTLPINERGENGDTNSIAERILAIPEGYSLINQAGMCLDTNQQPVIATWWAAGTGTNNYRRQYMVAFRDANGVWQVRQISHRTNDPPATKFPEADVRDLGRPVIVCDRDGRLIVLYRDNFGSNGLTIAHSLPYALDPQRTNWTTFDLTTANLGRYETVIDEARWALDRQLHVVYQPSSGYGYTPPANTAAQIAVLEWDAAAYFAHRPTLKISLTNATDTVLTWNAQPGWGYQIQSGTNLTAWENVAALPGIMGELRYTHTNGIWDFERYWRIEAREGSFAP